MFIIKNLFLLYIFVAPFIVNAQLYYFNERYESNSNTWSALNAIIETENGYLVGGSTGTPPNNSWHQINLIVLDKNGDKINEKFIGDTISEYYVAISSLINTYNNRITFTGSKHTYFADFPHDEGLLMQLDNDYDTLWSKFYGEKVLPFDSAYNFRQLIETSDSNLLMVGTMVPKINYKDNLYLLKVDGVSTFIWERFYGILNSDYKLRGYSVIETADKGFALGAYRFKPGYNETAMPMVYKTDSLGNEEWHISIGGPIFDTKSLLCNAHDGNIMAAFCYADSMTGSDAYRTINIQKIDLEGNVIWDKRYGPSDYDNRLSNIRQTFDGGYIVAGHVFTGGYPNPWMSGWLMKLNAEGDSLWYRTYYNVNGTYDLNYLYDVIPTTDNGFAACGQVWGTVTGNTQHAWAIKVDSMGCDTPGCVTGTSVVELSPYGGSRGEVFHIWPNPASSRLNVQSYELCVEGQKAITVFDIYGRKVQEIKVPARTETISIDVENWGRGLYFLRLTVDGVIKGGAKVVVQ